VPVEARDAAEETIPPGKPDAFGDEQPYFTQRTWHFFAEHLLEDRQTGADIYEKKPGRR
jgi:dipeptidyl-peptidase 4